MTTKGEFIVIRTLDPVDTGDVLSSIPPHLTDLSWFFLDNGALRTLKPRIDDLGDRYGYTASWALGKRRVLYGANEDIPACELLVAHDKIYRGLFSAVEKLGGEYKYPDYANNWSPHITDEHGVSIQEGESVSFSSLALISRQGKPGEKRKVVEHAVQLVGGISREAAS